VIKIKGNFFFTSALVLVSKKRHSAPADTRVNE